MTLGLAFIGVAKTNRVANNIWRFFGIQSFFFIDINFLFKFIQILILFKPRDDHRAELFDSVNTGGLKYSFWEIVAKTRKRRVHSLIIDDSKLFGKSYNY